MSDTFPDASDKGETPMSDAFEQASDSRNPVVSDASNPPSDIQPSYMSDAPQRVSDIARSATSRVTVRLATDDLDRIDAAAARLSATRSDYIRALLSLPVTLDVSSLSRAHHGVESIAPARSALVVGDPPREVQVLTDAGLSAIRSELNAIGVNYNQCVRALNRINRKYANRRTLPDDARAELVDLLERISKQNGTIFERVNAVDDMVADYASRPAVPLRVSKRSGLKTPINKETAVEHESPDRRKRVRGRKRHAGNAPGDESSDTPGTDSLNGRRDDSDPNRDRSYGV